jgi:hypothetical protein
MTEQLLTPPIAIEAAHSEHLAASHEAFAAQLPTLAEAVPEIADRHEAITQYGGQLIEEFQLKPELFDRTHTLFFAGIADRFAKLEQDKGSLNTDAYITEKEFILDATCMLAGDKTELYDQIKPLMNKDDDPSDEHSRAVYDRYTNVQVTAELKAAIDSQGLLDAVKERLAITSDNESPYILRVLNVGSSTTVQHGMHPTQSEKLDELSAAGNFKDPAWEEHFANVAAYKSYVKGLDTNGNEFRKALGAEGETPIAWVTHIDGVPNLVMPLPFAEKILYKDEARSKYYDERARIGDFATLEHEYTHTQDGLNLDGDIYYGIGFEERRAEFFSGDKQGYQDVKALAIDLRLTTGFDLVKYMQGSVKGGSAEVYEQLAAELGLQTALEIAICPPRPYVSEQRPMQQHVAEYLGGTSAIADKLYDRTVASDDTEAADTRMNEVAEKFASSPNFDFWAGYRVTQGASVKVTNELIRRVTQMRIEKGIVFEQD